jgi:hypothetical protein
MSIIGLKRKVLLEKFPGALLALFREHHRFRFAHRIQDHSLFVKTFHGIPIMPFPSPSVCVKGKIEKRQHHLIDFILIVPHALTLSSDA